MDQAVDGAQTNVHNRGGFASLTAAVAVLSGEVESPEAACRAKTPTINQRRLAPTKWTHMASSKLACLNANLT